MINRENWEGIADRARTLSAELDKPARGIGGPPSTGCWKSKIHATRSWKSVADHIEDALKYSEQAGVRVV